MIEHFPSRKTETLKTFTIDPLLPLEEQLQGAQEVSRRNNNVWVEATYPSGGHVGMIDMGTDLNEVIVEFEKRRNAILGAAALGR